MSGKGKSPAVTNKSIQKGSKDRGTNTFPFDGIRQEDLRQIGSMSPECTELKKKYDTCFNEWFATRFLMDPLADMAPCTELLEQYTNCVKAACAKLGISTSAADCPPIKQHKSPLPPKNK